jgi:RHS repeat-associated protein
MSETDNGAAINYTYDALNEILTAQRGTSTSSWTYDPVGNRLKQVASNGTTGYTYDAADRMLTAGTTTFTYDKNGNRLTAGTETYAYDALNRLISTTGSSGASTFAYDGDGNRIIQTTPHGTYSYVNDPMFTLPVVVNESGPDGNIDYAYGLGLGPMESSSSSFNYFYHSDGLGSVVNLTNLAGTVQETYSYDAWGNALTASGTVGTRNKFRFTGQELDPATGLYFLRARYYDPLTGRFVSRDPAGGRIGIPLSLNRYAYALNNGVNHGDPTGLCTVPNEPGTPFTNYMTAPLNDLNLAGQVTYSVVEWPLIGTAAIYDDFLHWLLPPSAINSLDCALNGRSCCNEKKPPSEGNPPAK